MVSELLTSHQDGTTVANSSLQLPATLPRERLNVILECVFFGKYYSYGHQMTNYGDLCGRHG